MQLRHSLAAAAIGAVCLSAMAGHLELLSSRWIHWTGGPDMRMQTALLFLGVAHGVALPWHRRAVGVALLSMTAGSSLLAMAAPMDPWIAPMSLGTFMALWVIGITWVTGVKPCTVAWAVAVIGGLALVGHALEMPTLYWSSPGMSYGMALPTAVCLVAAAIGMGKP